MNIISCKELFSFVVDGTDVPPFCDRAMGSVCLGRESVVIRLEWIWCKLTELVTVIRSSGRLWPFNRPQTGEMASKELVELFAQQSQAFNQLWQSDTATDSVTLLWTLDIRLELHFDRCILFDPSTRRSRSPSVTHECSASIDHHRKKNNDDNKLLISWTLERFPFANKKVHFKRQVLIQNRYPFTITSMRMIRHSSNEANAEPYMPPYKSSIKWLIVVDELQSRHWHRALRLALVDHIGSQQPSSPSSSASCIYAHGISHWNCYVGCMTRQPNRLVCRVVVRRRPSVCVCAFSVCDCEYFVVIKVLENDSSSFPSSPCCRCRFAAVVVVAAATDERKLYMRLFAFVLNRLSPHASVY